MLEEESGTENAEAETQKSGGLVSGIVSSLSSYIPPLPSTQGIADAYQERISTPLNEKIFEDAKAICADDGIAGQGPPLDPR